MRFRLNLSPRARRRLDKIKSRVSWYIGYPFFVLGNFFRAVGMTLASWWQRRNIRFLLQGLPALVMTIGVLTFGALVYAQDRNSLTNDYQRLGYTSLQEAGRQLAKNEEATAPLAMAETCFQRLVVLQDKPEHRYPLAQILELKKQPAAFVGLLQTMAPEGKTGYGPAHVALARMYLQGRLPPPKGSNGFRAAENHFLRAIQTKESAPIAHYTLFELYKLWNMPKEAEKHLDEAAKFNAEWRLVQARWYLVTGKADKGKLFASTAAEVFRQRIETNPDDMGARLNYSDALILTGKFADALEVLRQGATLAQANPALQAHFAVRASAAHVGWYDAKANDPSASAVERFEQLEKALKWYPNNPDTFQRLMAFARQKGPEAEKAKKAVHDMTLGAQPSFLAHLYLGIEAWQDNNAVEARHHWEKAFALSPGSSLAPLVANNLAWVVAFTEPKDLTRALTMIDAAIEKAPNDARMRGTRGHILANLGRHQEALPELEKSIPLYPTNEKLFRQLAETCTHLKLSKMAQDYKQRADEIAEKSKTKPGSLVIPGPDTKPDDAPKAPPIPAAEGPAPGGNKAGGSDAKAPPAPPKP